MVEEEIKEIKGKPGYFISKKGVVFSNRLRKSMYILNPEILVKKPYRRVMLQKERFLVHRLVAEAFLPNPENHPVVNHKDNDPSNNTVENLEWCTHSHNSIHMFNMGYKRAKGEKCGSSVLREIDVLKIRSLYEKDGISTRKIASEFKIGQSTVIHILHRRTWGHI